MAEVQSPPLLAALASQLPDEWLTMALARRRQALEALQDQERSSGRWDAQAALQQALLWLIAGLPGRGDDLVLEAAELAPSAQLIPDWWGLWPHPPEGLPASAPVDPAALRELVNGYLQLRHANPLDHWRLWLQSVQADRRNLDQPTSRLLLGLVINGRERLPGPLEPALEQLVGEEVVATEPALAWRFFDAVSERLPSWSYGRIKAADLSLQRGDLQRCAFHLERATPEQQQLAWLQDIAARHALACGDVVEALQCWQLAMDRCRDDQAVAASAPEVLEIFRQRAREARRGPGVLQARALLNRGQQAEAVALLERLLRDDPQWQPLRSLLEQTRTPAPMQASPPGQPSPSAIAVDAGEPQRLEAQLQRLAARAGLPWPPPCQEQAEPELSSHTWERFLQRATGRLALLP